MKTNIFHYDNIIGEKIYQNILFLQNTFDKEKLVKISLQMFPEHNEIVVYFPKINKSVGINYNENEITFINNHKNNYWKKYPISQLLNSNDMLPTIKDFLKQFLEQEYNIFEKENFLKSCIF